MLKYVFHFKSNHKQKWLWSLCGTKKRQQSTYRNKTLFASLVCLVKLIAPKTTPKSQSFMGTASRTAQACNQITRKLQHLCTGQRGCVRSRLCSKRSAEGSFSLQGTLLGLSWSAVYCATPLVQWQRPHLAEMTRKRYLDEIKISIILFRLLAMLQSCMDPWGSVLAQEPLWSQAQEWMCWT